MLNITIFLLEVRGLIDFYKVTGTTIELKNQ